MSKKFNWHVVGLASKLHNSCHHHVAVSWTSPDWSESTTGDLCNAAWMIRHNLCVRQRGHWVKQMKRSIGRCLLFCLQDVWQNVQPLPNMGPSSHYHAIDVRHQVSCLSTFVGIDYSVMLISGAVDNKNFSKFTIKLTKHIYAVLGSDMINVQQYVYLGNYISKTGLVFLY